MKAAAEQKPSDKLPLSAEKIAAELDEGGEETPEEGKTRRRRVVHKKVTRTDDEP